jgi:hypothetical protein
MKQEEREMVYEINRVRSDQKSYLQYIEPLLLKAKNTLRNSDKGEKNYSRTCTTNTMYGKETKKIDTTWHYTNLEEVKALSTLVIDQCSEFLRYIPMCCSL